MKYFWILSLILVGACGKVVLPEDAKLVPEKLTDRLVVGNELNDYAEICGALNTKKINLPSLIGTPYVFAGSTKGCTDPAFAQLPDAHVTLELQSSEFKFLEGNNAAYFSEVEEINKGAFADICSNLNKLISPMSKDGINFVHFSTDAAPGDCPRVADEVCVKFSKGVKKTIEGVEMSDIHTREWIRVKLARNIQPLPGFWSYKKRLSSAGCVSGFSFARTATLK